MESIAIVDDDYIYQYTTKKIITAINFVKTVFTFSDGKAAYEYLLANRSDPALLPDVILLDLNMPGMNGFEFLQEFLNIKSSLSKSIDIYVVSSSIDPREVTRVKNIPAVVDFIPKPITVEQLKKIAVHFNM